MTDSAPNFIAPAPGEWTFEDPAIAKAFDRHVREQLPWYDIATGIVTAAGRAFIPEGGLVYDVGASTGNVGRAIEDTLKSRKARLIAIEPSQDMRALYTGPGELKAYSADACDFEGADLIVCFLVLMFVPVSGRAALIKRMRDALRPGGALLIFDKTTPAAGDVGAMSMRLTLAAKYEAGATPQEIIAKELSLAGVQRPLYPTELEGFAPVFRFGDFGGWIIVSQPAA
jgi:tRNA (cmo5U34)-methyltransferase